ncbi:D-glycero-beta-D-manno-heptose 1-phosphate adenylyltransferase [Candidatus Dependentiae bacterium]|nr:D-glycero-beta-D-manno-heptose 1-phosphate adenylyltransferase [Candidatus Dependentiae bacterium]
MKQLVQSLKQAGPKDVVIIGDLMLDEYLIGSVSRVSPEAPVPVLKERETAYSFGGATNVAVNCRRVGCNVSVIGLLGADDKAGNQLYSMLVEKKICVEGIVKSADRATTCKKRIVAQRQQLLRIDTEETHALSEFERDNLICSIHTVIRPGSLVVISDYAKGSIDRSIIEEVFVRAKLCGSLVIADPKGPDFSKYKGVDYLKPNLKEFSQLVDFFGLSQDDSVIENGRDICEKLSLQGLIVTMGEKGLQLITKEKEIFYQASKREVYDITGAGDTVLAFLAVGLANRFSLDQSLKLATTAASIAVSHHKTYAVGLDDLVDVCVSTEEKICSDWSGLRDTIGWLRKTENKTVVFTNGCFDLLHSGHIYLLREAKKRGDLLVVALNTDDSISRLKGPARPIKTLEERASILAAIDVVDYVVSFDQDTPYKLIDYLKPDVLIKGGDYQVERIVGYDVVTSYGGVVETVKHKDGLSTTILVENVKLCG